MTVRSMSAQSHKLFGTNWRFQIAIMRIFNRISSDLSSPMAEVRGSNPFGRASFDPYRTTRDPSQRDVSMANIKMSVSIDAPPERVFPLAATPQGLARWWAADATESDGLVDLGFFKRATVYRLQPVRSVAPRGGEWRCLG